MSLVVHMEAVVDGVIFEFGYVTGDVDDRHPLDPTGPKPVGRGNTRTPRGRRSDTAAVRIPSLAVTSPENVLQVLHDAARAVNERLRGLADWGPAGTRPGQYRSDLVADAAALEVIDAAGFGAFSEESGVHHGERSVLVVVDPVDGSTNASRGLPWWATSLCALDDHGALAAVVVNQATGSRFEAVRGGGAFCDGRPISPTDCPSMDRAIVAFSGYPDRWLGWLQYRSLGAAALDLCAVAEGVLDGYAVVGGSLLGSWDYLGGMLVCSEAGAVVGEAGGRELVTLAHDARRAPFAASTPALLEAFLAAAAQ